MELQGKVVNFLGDSITDGVGASSVEKNYVNVFGRIAHTAEVRNYGVSGSRIADVLDRSPDPIGMDYFGARAAQMKKADFIVVFGGTNDYGHGDSPLGNNSNRSDKTFYGAMHNLCKLLITQFAESQIVFVTPIHRKEENKLVNERGIRNCTNLQGYVDIIIEVCGQYGIPVYDAYRNSGICPDIQENCELFTIDGLHPNDKGHELLANKFVSYIKSL